VTRTTIVIAAALALAVTLPAAPAQATGAARTFVSAAGSDTNNCTNVATPCRHLANAYAATAPEGEIYVLDPANYGSLTITGPVSIEGHGWASIAPVSGQAAITINAQPTDRINIIGVVLDGTALSGTTGIAFNSGGRLTVRDSVIRNFGSNGISFTADVSISAPDNPAKIFMSNTVVSDNAGNGIYVAPTGSGTIQGIFNRVEVENNKMCGLLFQSDTQAIEVTISDSVSGNNGSAGIFAHSSGGTPDTPTPARIMVRNSTLANNGDYGLQADNPGATIFVTRSTIAGNAFDLGATLGGVVKSYGDNNIDNNGNISTPPVIPYH
jgi:Right handed beta helix region